ncbi:lysozyme inhibitor LprI family protein [Herbaspirillum sp. GCM10030257]|uniref:lysozyme inhibitor LprI family protein n=1 Tax=Herbaspirillum sp. GCM10030257 TaxID=3273393 RepID=UPI0036082BB6
MKIFDSGSAVLILAAVALVGCGKDIPSCGDAEVTNLVSQIMAENVWKDSGTLQEDFKKRVSFAVEQPVIGSHDEKAPRYTCKAVATYKVSDAVLGSLLRADEDKTYQVALWKDWRRLIGVFSADDVGTMMMEWVEAADKGASNKMALQEELSHILGIDKSSEDRMFAAAVMAYPAQKANMEIKRNADLITEVLKSMDEKSKKVAIEVKYTISRIDVKGERQFQVEAGTEHNHLLEGIQNLQVLESAAQQVKERAAAKPAAVQALSAPTQPATPAVQTAEQGKPESAVPVPQAASESKSQPAAESDAKKAVIEASFDCAKASAKIEKLICSTSEAANADKRLAVAYAAAKGKVTDQQKLKTEQMEWMKQQRNSCNEAACLVKVTEDRIQTLSSF